MKKKTFTCPACQRQAFTEKDVLRMLASGWLSHSLGMKSCRFCGVKVRPSYPLGVRLLGFFLLVAIVAGLSLLFTHSLIFFLPELLQNSSSAILKQASQDVSSLDKLLLSSSTVPLILLFSYPFYVAVKRFQFREAYLIAVSKPNRAA
jgi:hypothetical protein